MNEEIQALLDKQAITEVIFRYCRGLDRMDKELSLTCWHPGGTDDHAPLYKGSAEGFLDWLWPVHAAMEATRHFVSNITIELSGDKAAVESYWHLCLRIPRDGKTFDLVGHGRYLDNFEKIDGVWAIRHRASIGDIIGVTEQIVDLAEINPPLIMPNNLDAQPIHGARDRSDYSYELFASIHGSD